MKYVIIFSFLLFVKILPAQIYSDAIKLRKYSKKDSIRALEATIRLTDESRSILRKYIDTTLNLDLSRFFNGDKNTDPNPFIEVSGSEQGMFTRSAKSLMSSVGGVNVTNFADGLAKFLVERTKQELSISFFQKFQEEISRSEELQALFPSAYKVLKTIDQDIYIFDAYLNVLREAFVKDMINLYDGLYRLEKLPKYKKYFEEHPELYTFLNASFFLINQYAYGAHPGKALAEFDTNRVILKYPNSTHNARNSIAIAQLFSESLRSGSNQNYWISEDSLSLLWKDPVLLNIYLGLLYLKGENISFYSGKQVYSFQATLEKVKKTKEGYQDTLTKYIEYIQRLHSNYLEVDMYLNSISQSKEKDYNQYYLLYGSAIDLIEDGFRFIDLPYVNLEKETELDLQNESGRWIIIARTTGELYLDVRTKNYSSAVLNVLTIMDTLNLDDEKLRGNILKYGTFAAAVAQAQNSDEVKQAIEAIALPAGSSRIKRNSDFNISVNSFVGINGGAEYMPASEEAWKPAFSIAAPVGIYWGWGNTCKGKLKKDSSRTDGKAHGFFFSLIDVGALVSYRFGDPSTTISSEIKLQNIVAPGLYYHFGFGKCPISLLIGAQAGPQLRKVDPAVNVALSENFYFRTGATLAVDIPVVNLFTRNK